MKIQHLLDVLSDRRDLWEKFFPLVSLLEMWGTISNSRKKFPNFLSVFSKSFIRGLLVMKFETFSGSVESQKVKNGKRVVFTFENASETLTFSKIVFSKHF